MADRNNLTQPGDDPHFAPLLGALPNLLAQASAVADSLILRAWIPYSAPVGAGGRYIVNVIRPDGRVRYQIAHSATMDAWHQSQRGYHFDSVIPVPQQHSIQVFFDGTMDGYVEWLSGHPV